MKIANINYPKLKQIDTNKYLFEIKNKYFQLSYREFSDYTYMELNYKNELILRKSLNTLFLYKNQQLDDYREFQYDEKIFHCFSVSNGNYIVSSIDKENNHWLLLLSEDLKIIKKQKVGLTSWHSQDAIGEKDGIIMYGEYNVAKKSIKVSIFRSLDMGISWEKVFSLNAPEDIRHWHTVQPLQTNNNWLITSGDTVKQSRWYISKNHGDSWDEITDKSYRNESVPNKSLSAHRTTCVYEDDVYYYWATDDLMGSVKDYFLLLNGERKASSKFYRSMKTEPLHIEKLSSLGVHVRSIIDVKNGYLLLTEGKYVTYNAQLFYMDKSDLSSPYFLCDIPSDKAHGGTYSMHSKVINNKFYVRHILSGKIKTLEFDFSLLPIHEKLDYNIENYIRFEEHLWFINKKDHLKDMVFYNNKVKLMLNEKEGYFYLILGNSIINGIDAKELFKLNDDVNKVIISFNLEKKKDTLITLYVQGYDNNGNKFSTISFDIKSKINQIELDKEKIGKYIKLLFRIASSAEDEVVLSNLNLDLKVKKIDNIIKSHICKKLNPINEKFYLLTFPHSYRSDSFNFKARRDCKYFKIDLPFNWDVNPFGDNNWMFQLHSLRLLDNEIAEYMQTKDTAKLNRLLEVVMDWKEDIVTKKQNSDYDMKEKNSLAWHDMATGLRSLKIAYLFEELIRLDNPLFTDKYLDELYDLVIIHIEVLSNQKLALTNHAIYQLHGLMMLLRLFPSSNTQMHDLTLKTEKQMQDIFYNQFFKEGMHKENSSGYHLLAIITFDKILDHEIYPDLKEIFEVLKKAKENCAYMHFPNFESLMTGDSDYKIVKKHKEEKIIEGITHFKESGYTYIYEENNNPSMFFFDTAFLNRAHRHADFFNVLLYEYDKNILVDAGKYSYAKDNPFREYCISSRAHNLVLIDNQDYKLDRKYFFTSKLLKKEKKEDYYYLMASNYYDYFETSYDRHIYYKPQEFLLVVDVLISKENKNFKQIFHLHQDLEVVEEESFLKTIINDDVMMYTKMKSLDMNENKIYSNISFSKGVDGEIEGYRALGHNEVVENYVLVNEAESNHVVMGSMFSFNKQRNFNLVSIEKGRLEILFDSYQEIIEG